MLTAFLRTIVADISTSHQKIHRGSHAHLDPVTRRLIFLEFDKTACRVPILSILPSGTQRERVHGTGQPSSKGRRMSSMRSLTGGPISYVLRPRCDGKFYSGW